MKLLNPDTLILLLKAADLLLLVFALYSVIMAFSEKRQFGAGEDEYGYGPWLPAVGLVLAGAVTVIGLLPIEGAWMLCLAVIVLLRLICGMANKKLSWDTDGFWCRTAFRRSIRYEYADIRRPRTVKSNRGCVFRFRAGKRLIQLNVFLPWNSFLSAYDAWRIRNGLMRVRQEEERRWLEKYWQHGPFRRKLDRIPNGLEQLIVLLVLGLMLAGACVYGLLTIDSQDILGYIGGVLGILAGMALPLTFVYAVSRMDKKLLRAFVKGRIHGDPGAPPKRYRRKN